MRLILKKKTSKIVVVNVLGFAWSHKSVKFVAVWDKNVKNIFRFDHQVANVVKN